jgi:hypothetical protein
MDFQGNKSALRFCSIQSNLIGDILSGIILRNALEITSYSQGQNPDNLTGVWTMGIGCYFLDIPKCVENNKYR